MPLDVRDAMGEGARRTVAPGGLQLVGALAVVSLATAVVIQSLFSAYAAVLRRGGVELPPGFPPPPPLSLDLPLGAVLAAWLAVAVVAEAVYVVGVRSMVRERGGPIPADLLTHNIGFAVLNGFVGGVVVQVLIVLGLVLLVVPGVFAAVAFFFVRQAIAVEDRNFVDAMERSWTLTAGSRLEVFLLGAFVVAVVVAGAAVPARLASVVFGEASVVPPLVSAPLQGAAITFSIAAASRPYVQLRAAEPAASEDDGWDDPPGVTV